MLATLVSIPALIVFYLRRQRIRAERRRQLSQSGLVTIGVGADLGWKRHVPFGLFLCAVAVLLVAFARPQAVVSLPERSGTVIIALDVSASMQATDVDPTRLDEAKRLAQEFAASVPTSILVGVVTFGDGALVTQAPTDDRALVADAIDRSTPGGATSAGEGILASLTAIVGEPIAIELDPETGEPTADIAELVIGFFPWASVVLISDGENTSDPDPLEVAEVATTAGVKVWTLGVGTSEGSVLDIDTFRVSTALDEQALIDIAIATGATYTSAAEADALESVTASIDLRLTNSDTPQEVTGILAMAAIVLLVASAAASGKLLGRLL